MAERWLPVPEWEGLYEVSDQGRVRSVDRYVPASRGGQVLRRGRILQPHPAGSGYLRVRLCNGARRWRPHVHILVAAVFLGSTPDGQEVRHRNDVKADNRAANLVFGTRSDNLHDSVRNGRHFWAKRTHCSNHHEYTAANTRIQIRNGNRIRVCRTCKRNNDAARRQSRAA